VSAVCFPWDGTIRTRMGPLKATVFLSSRLLLLVFLRCPRTCSSSCAVPRTAFTPSLCCVSSTTRWPCCCCLAPSTSSWMDAGPWAVDFTGKYHTIQEFPSGLIKFYLIIPVGYVMFFTAIFFHSCIFLIKCFLFTFYYLGSLQMLFIQHNWWIKWIFYDLLLNSESL